jgi:hypothetical protein
VYTGAGGTGGTGSVGGDGGVGSAGGAGGAASSDGTGSVGGGGGDGQVDAGVDPQAAGGNGGGAIDPPAPAGSDGGVALGRYPLSAAPGKHYLVDAQGVPYLMVGEAAWSLAVAVQLPDAISYFDQRAALGFNTALVNVIEHYYSPSPPLNAYGDAPFTATLPGSTMPDFSAPNEAYFARLDALVAAAGERGIMLMLVPAYLGASSFEGWYAELEANGAARAAAYGRFLGTRYASSPNIMWVGGADTNPLDPAPTDAMMSGILATDPGHLATAHCNVGTPPPLIYGGQPWFKVDSVYTYPTITGPVWKAARAEYTRSGWMPYMLIESPYESEGIATPPSMRQDLYELLLDGGFGKVFGNGQVWRFGSDWRKNMGTVGAADTARVTQTLGSVRWYDLAPDIAGTFLISGGGSGFKKNSAALTADGRLGAVYVPAVRLFTLDLSRMAGPATARWVDPTTGASTPVPGGPFSGLAAFAPTGNNAGGGSDWLLIVEVK